MSRTGYTEEAGSGVMTETGLIGGEADGTRTRNIQIDSLVL